MYNEFVNFRTVEAGRLNLYTPGPPERTIAVAEDKRIILSSRTLPSWRRAGRAFLAPALAAILLAALIWELLAIQSVPPAASGPLPWLGIVVLSALLAGAGDWVLSGTQLPERWQYRLATGLSLVTGLVAWVTLQAGPGRALPPGLLAASAAGALTGSMLASWSRRGFYENNQPPSDYIRREVADCHLELIGTPPRGDLLKRLFDAVLAAGGLLVSAPVWILIGILIWIEDPGPVIFIKNSVGKRGANFHQLKFRTMVSGAEVDTGPIPARESDSRVLRTGAFLRKTALDELPQLFNILKGEMSFVGPRPQRTVLVYVYLRDMPEFAERHAVLPGLAGLAQVAGDYFLTPRQKLRYDRLYARHASLGLDMKLLAIAFALVFWLRWQPDWDGRIPRSWLH